MTSAVATVRIMAFSPLAPRFARAFIIWAVATAFVPRAMTFVFLPVDLFQTLDECHADAAALTMDDADAHWLRPFKPNFSCSL